MKTINFIENCKLKIANYLRKGFTPPLHARAGFIPPLRAGAGFTLLELLVVIAIIVILAVILMPALSAAQRRAQEARTEAMISSLRLAISMFDTDVGRIPGDPALLAVAPIPPAGHTHRIVHRELVGLEPPARPTGWAGPYMELRVEDIRNEEIVDFWGNAFQFRSDTAASRPPGAPAGHRVYIWSFGSNRENESGGGDDIRSW